MRNELVKCARCVGGNQPCTVTPFYCASTLGGGEMFSTSYTDVICGYRCSHLYCGAYTGSFFLYRGGFYTGSLYRFSTALWGCEGFPALWGMVKRAEASIRLDGVFLQLWISLVV